jgi:ABC-type transport system involved in cytochrome c biogenesis permease subunit
LKNSPDFYLAAAAAVLYLAGALIEGLNAVAPRRALKRASLGLVAAGLVLHTVALVERGITGGSVPLTDLFEYTLVLTWAVAFAYLAVFRKRLEGPVSTSILALVFLILGVGVLYLHTDPSGAKMPALKSYWLYVHVSLAALGETFFAIAFVASVIYLAKMGSGDSERLKSLDDLAYRAISIGFPLFTLGAMVAGAIWAKRAWGAYWSWDPKEVLSLVVWLVYAAYLHARLVRDMRGALTAITSIVGFLLTMFTIFSSLVFGGLHSYG